jgi:hypothetical protein
MAAWAAEERGSSIVEGLLALGLVVAVFAVGAEALVFVEARTIAIAAAQEGARAAALGGETAGLASARAVLAAGGGLTRGLSPSIEEQGATVTAVVEGSAPALFHVGILLPAIRSAATVPRELYPVAEQGTSR